jgi:hypothetical protein
MPDIDIIKMKFIFSDGSILEINDKSFRAAITKVMTDHLTFENQPLKVVFPTTKKVLYFDLNTFYAYLKEDIDQMELIEKTQCQGLFRNNTFLKTNTDEEIEPHCLWKKHGSEMHLVDDDIPVISPFREELFTEV